MESKEWHLASFLSLIIFTLCHRTQGQAIADCPADGRMWVPFGQSCYHFIHGDEAIAKRYSIENAKDMCKGSALLTVHSSEENDFIANYSTNVWQGDINVWLGMYYSSDDDGFKWNDESPLTFKNWEEGGMEDSEVALIDTCVTLHVASGKWESVSCLEEPENGVVCKTAQMVVVPEKKNGNPVLSALVILSVIVILGISAVVWFLQQRNSSGSSLLPSFEYHPPFRAPSADQTCLVEAEEIEEMS